MQTFRERAVLAALLLLILLGLVVSIDPLIDPRHAEAGADRSATPQSTATTLQR